LAESRERRRLRAEERDKLGLPPEYTGCGNIVGVFYFSGEDAEIVRREIEESRFSGKGAEAMKAAHKRQEERKRAGLVRYGYNPPPDESCKPEPPPPPPRPPKW
jgi:hypothetical protein